MSVDSSMALPKEVIFSVGLVVCIFLLGFYGTWGYGAELPEAQTPADQHALRQEKALKEAEAARKNIEATSWNIGRCTQLGYWQQLKYHQARLAVEEEVIKRWELDGKIATLAESDKPVPEAMARELKVLERNDAIRTLVAETLGQIMTLRHDQEIGDTAKVTELENELAEAWARLSELTEVSVYSATEKWADAQERITSVQKPYGWHVAKLTLLRDLIHRTQRLRFYLTNAVGAGDQEQRLVAMVPAGSHLEDILQRSLHQWPARAQSFSGPEPFGQWLKRIEYETQRFQELYGDCYFGQKIQPLLLQAELAAQLESQTIELPQRLQALNESRNALEEDVLRFLADFDKDDKFTSLGIPYRDPDMRIEPDGQTSQLVFCTSPEGLLGEANSDALCIDAADGLWHLWSTGRTLKAQGVFGEVPDSFTYRTARLRERGYFFKQPIAVNTLHGGTPVAHASFLDEHKDDPDILMAVPGGGRSGQSGRFLNFWHPAVREMLGANLRAIVGYCKKQPGFLFYDKLIWEANPHLGGPGWQIGYNNRYALAAFREYLKQKFGSIEWLNERWRSAYDSFEAIQLPDHSLLGQPRLRTPLIYEFEAFQQWSWVEHLKMCAEAVRQEDPHHPILSEVRIGSAYLQAQLPVQYLDSHCNNAVNNYASNHWLYDLCLHTGKLPAEDEYIWTYPRTQTLHKEQDVRVHGTLSVWRKMVWGYKALNVFGSFNYWEYNHGLTDERYTVLQGRMTPGIEMSLLREAATAITLGKKRAREFWPILSRTEVAQPSVGLVADSPEVKWDQILTSRDYGFRYLSQQLIVDKPQVLSPYRLLILPLIGRDPARVHLLPGYANPDGLDAALLKWVQSGGTLICSGIPGMYDKYGFESGRLMERIFGEEITYQTTDSSVPIWNEYQTWNIQVSRQDSPVTIELSQEGRPALISARFGKGMVLVSTEPLLGSKLIHRRMQDILFAYMDRVAGLPTASSDRHRFEVIMREDSNGQRYLFIINPGIDQRAEDLVVVKGEYRQVIDLGISSVCAIPLIPREPVVVKSRDYTTEYQSAPGTTSFFMRLQPGEGTVLKLIP